MDRCISYDLTFTLNGEHDVLLCQTAHISVVVSDLSHHNYEIGTVSNKRLSIPVGVKTQLG